MRAARLPYTRGTAWAVHWEVPTVGRLLYQNIQWIFSGIGVAVLGAVVAALRRHRRDGAVISGNTRSRIVNNELVRGDQITRNDDTDIYGNKVRSDGD
jgi:hypothetical protein